MAVVRSGQLLTDGATKLTASGFQVPFKREEFEALIKTHGYDVTWEKAAYCPFLKGTNPRAHDFNCKACHNGFIYFDAQSTRVVMSSLNLSQQYYAYGRFDSGRAQITALPEFKISFWDRITLCNSRARFSEVVTRQRGTDRDKLHYEPLCIVYLAWPKGTTLLTATEGVDFTIDTSTGELVWNSTNRPGADTRYTIVYFYRPIYIVTDVPHQVRDENVAAGSGVVQKEFPVQVIGQLDQFIRDEGRDRSDESESKNPFAPEDKDRWQGT